MNMSRHLQFRAEISSSSSKKYKRGYTGVFRRRRRGVTLVCSNAAAAVAPLQCVGAASSVLTAHGSFPANLRGHSSNGRALAWHTRGRGIDQLHMNVLIVVA
jgi:hypothetical protein